MVHRNATDLDVLMRGLSCFTAGEIIGKARFLIIGRVRRRLFYTTYISVDLAHHEISGGKVGKGGIKQHKEGL